MVREKIFASVYGCLLLFLNNQSLLTSLLANVANMKFYLPNLLPRLLPRQSAPLSLILILVFFRFLVSLVQEENSFLSFLKGVIIYEEA